MHGYENRTLPGSGRVWRVLPLLVAIFMCPAHRLAAQAGAPASVTQQIQNLTDAIARTQSLLDASQRQLDQMRSALVALEGQVSQEQAAGSQAQDQAAQNQGQGQAAQGVAPAPSAAVPEGAPSTAYAAPSTAASQPASSSQTAAPSSEPSSASAGDVAERQALDESQIATLDQEKVESESKYPVRLTGMLLFNGFVNTGAVDLAATPSVALSGPGSTGASMRQTELGFDARGPQLLGARSFGDLRVDFDGVPQSGNLSSGYYTANTTLLRLRTAHAALLWKRTEAYFALDRPIFSPDTPSSLTAVAVPLLSWSGNLWTWNPQFGVRQDVALGSASDLRFEAAVMDVGDAPLTATAYNTTSVSPGPASSAQQSGWPGAEARIALVGPESEEQGNHLGFGGYFAPHRTAFGKSFDAWAATVDAGLHLPGRLRVSSSFYRGLALGGLGGGAYKDFVYGQDPDTGAVYLRPLDDVGGWAQLKEKFSERVQFNGAFGIDNAFAAEVGRYASASTGFYQNLARNRTFTGNVIFSPSAYLLFSLEYRHITSSPVGGAANQSNVIGLAAGYKF
jgi:hypothetical protein